MSTDMDTSGPSATGQKVELYAIQRSWFNGPHFEPSVDCRRLFISRREAEEVAYHSAHAFANQSIFSSNSNSPSGHLNASVKTILLPPSLNGPPASYAYQTCGKLFWVRPLRAAWVPHLGQSQAAGVTYPLSVQPPQHFTMAEVVLTEGIIGGNGNPNSQRGSEVAEGRVFVSTDQSSANRAAVDAARDLHLSMAHNPLVKISVMTFPVGKGQQINFTTDWPASLRMELPPQQWTADPMSNPFMSDYSAVTKRDWNASIQADPRVNSFPSKRPSKRQCQFFRHEAHEAKGVPCSMMTN